MPPILLQSDKSSPNCDDLNVDKYVLRVVKVAVETESHTAWLNYLLSCLGKHRREAVHNVQWIGMEVCNGFRVWASFLGRCFATSTPTLEGVSDRLRDEF